MHKMLLRSIKVDQWPLVWQERWLLSKAPAENPFDEGGRASGWSVATLSDVERAVGTFLAWLQAKGDFDPEKPLSVYVDKEKIKEFLVAYEPGRAEATVAAAVRGIAYFLRATVPPDGLPWLTKLAHRMSNSAKPSRPKLPRMASIAELINLGCSLMEAGTNRLSKGQTSGAHLYRNGLMIAALAARPTLRVKNFSALRLGHTFFREHQGYEARVPRNQTKTKNLIVFRYPSWLTEPFDVYLDKVRPRLAAGTSGNEDGWLWIGRSTEQALTPTTVTDIISGTTERHIGRRTSSHLFRDCAATDIALFAAADIGITKDVLGHATLASSQDHYNQARSFTALASLEAILLGLMDG